MTKQEYILKLLTALEKDWPLASGLKLLVQAHVLDGATLDALFGIFSSAVHTVSDIHVKEKLEKAKTMVQKLKDMEAVSHQQDEKDLSELDDMLNSL